jgi:hypothetical protein
MTTRQNKVPRKGDIIINPKTQRPIRVGSRTWLKLVKDGLVEGRYSDPKELYEVKDPQNQGEIEAKINELNKTLPPNVQGVRGRGRYKNKIVKRRKQPSTREITQHTAKTAARAVSNNIENLTDCEDLEAQLENMIMSELLGTSGLRSKTTPITIPKRGRGRPKKKAPEPELYETQEAPEYDEPEVEPDEYDYTEYENYEYEE